MENIDLDSKNNLYVADLKNDRIQKFTKDGNFTLEWGSRGDKDGEFESPAGVAVDSSDNVYVIDDTGRIQKFSSNCTFIASWGSDGIGDGQFSKSEGLDVDPDGYVYVADTGNKRIQVFALSNSTVAPTK
jgi:DNA-binding beta-propeller fold protein YncE